MFRLLLLEDNEDDALLVRLALDEHAPGEFAIIWVKQLADALAQIRTEHFDALLSDLDLPDSRGRATVQAIAAQAPALPLVVLTGGYDDALGREAIRYGANDYLLKGESGGRSIARALRYAIESKRHEIGLRVANEALERRVAERTLELEIANRTLHESEQELRAIFDGALDGILVADVTTRKLLTANAAICGMLGYAHEEIVRIGVADIHPQQDLPRVTARFESQLRGEIQMAANTPVRRKDGTVFYADVKAALIRFGGKDCLLGIFRDVTERVRAEQKIIEAEAQFRGLVEQSIAGTYIIQDGKFVYVNPRFAEIFGYGSADDLIGREASSLVAEKDRSAVAEKMRRPIGGEMASISYDFTGLRKNGSMFDVGVHGSRATHRGRPAVIGLIQDISEKKRAEEAIRHSFEQLKIAFMGTVEVAMIMSEMRDPYTTGHERRMAELAVAIGAELGFDVHRQEGLRVAGQLHDIGKINVPSEILSKPGKLSVIEFQLIQGHPQASYDVLKGVEWPWPVAQVALQHHERMDGSGYPQGLKGEAILPNARIMAVADVVEAMSSHRPYRPGLGIEKALAEIERGRGTVYDTDAADACLRLFREGRYKLPV